MIFPFPRTGPSRRCKLQLMTQIKLSRFSREPSVSDPKVSGSSVTPSGTAKSGASNTDADTMKDRRLQRAPDENSAGAVRRFALPKMRERKCPASHDPENKPCRRENREFARAG